MRLSPLNLKILAYTLDVEGFDATVVLKQCGIASFEDIQEDGEWVPLALFDRMMAAAIEATGDSCFGLVAGKSIALMKYGAITPLALSTPCLRQLLEDIRRFARLAVERSEIELVEGPQSAHLLVQPIVQGGLSGHFRMEQIAASAVQMLRFAGAGHNDILHVDLPYLSTGGKEQRYAAAFGSRINFGSKHCAVGFNPALLDQKMPMHDPVAYMTARTRADALLTAMQAGSDMAELVRQWLLSKLPHLPTVLETAEHLNMTERSFRRQLGMLHTTYADLLQECQRLMAERLLAEGKLPLKQIAEALGFSSVHSFHRAFRRWSGLTPSEWKESGGDTKLP